eukprot:TRINITY_DN5111_c0_g1_i1.p1 TRINITY_DN5111_c0_g1~~TRINITY_DN5111_c0_g1_i1.p1  ORF type:complete len:447 (-),score=97.17 TRINITY_DN5111_c0_g1_i1:9-1349(-)
MLPDGEDVFSCDEVSASVCKYLCRRGNVTVSQMNSWLRKPPELTCVRVNTFKSTQQQTISALKQHLAQENDAFDICQVNEEIITLKTKKKFRNEVVLLEHEVIVDVMCGLAVLRGANVFAPGILSLSPGSSDGDQVSVYADLDKKCLRGHAKVYTGRKVHVGNGLLKVSREQVFKENVRGIGVVMDDRVYNCPSIDERQLNGQLMLQNLPSILAVLELDPLPGHRVLDMCAAPGGKTMHIATKMKNSGYVVALDKSVGKIKQIQQNRDLQGFSNIFPHAFDSRKSVKDDNTEFHGNVDLSATPPPYPKGQFDRVLLDAPCSALGQRPQFTNSIRAKELASFPRVQRSLFRTAVDHLAPGGILIYSTCTLNHLENEGIVDWAAEQDFMSVLQPVPVSQWTTDTSLLNISSSSCDNNLDKNYAVFGHPSYGDGLFDTIGFFIAKYRKL